MSASSPTSFRRLFPLHLPPPTYVYVAPLSSAGTRQRAFVPHSTSEKTEALPRFLYPPDHTHTHIPAAHGTCRHSSIRHKVRGHLWFNPCQAAPGTFKKGSHAQRDSRCQKSALGPCPPKSRVQYQPWGPVGLDGWVGGCGVGGRGAVSPRTGWLSLPPDSLLAQQGPPPASHPPPVLWLVSSHYRELG